MSQEESLYSQARYAELRNTVEKQLPSLQGAPTERLFYLCTAYGKLKQYDKVFACAERLEANVRRGDVEAGLTDQSPAPWLIRAEAHLDLANYADTIAQAQLAYPMAKRHNLQRREVAALTYLGLAQALSGDAAAARRTVQRLETEYRPEWFDRERFMGIAKIQLALGEFDAALRSMRREVSSKAGFVMGVTESLAGPDVFAFMQLPQDFILAKAQFETGDIASATKGYDALLANRATASIGDIYWIVLFDRGQIEERAGRSAEALQYYRRAVEVIEQQRSTIKSEASKIGFVGDKQAVYGRLVGLLVRDGKAAEAFDYVERSKARALVDMLAAKRDFATEALEPARTQQILAELDAVDRAARIPDQAPAGAQTRTLQVARQEISASAPELASLVTVTSVQSGELARLLARDESLLEYYYQGEDLYAFVLRADGIRAVRLDGRGLGAAVQDWRGALLEPATSAWQAPSRALYQRLWKPLEGLLGSKRIVIVPHGALHYLPFAALQGPEGTFLADTHALRFMPAASVLKYLRTAPARQPLLLALGNPDLGDARLDLQFAETEAKAVASLYPDARLLVRKEASETNFKRAGRVFSRIHFATHGKFQADQPLTSGLYLAKDGENDGVLTVGELYSMSLDADLVTLSACETGLGKVANGDDVVGLTRGFLYAGSRSIVASLWSVDDRATADLMKAFYANLSRLPKQEALREAQRGVRRTNPHPFFWAAFELTGRGE